MFLPPEILRAIFLFARPYIHQHSPSVTLGPNNPWLLSLRTKKALTLVCKAWSAPATAVLYDDVVIRRTGQIPPLTQTLVSSKRYNHADLVRSIRLDSCVVWKTCEDTMHKDLCEIMRRCTRLTSFSFHPHPEFPLVLNDQDHTIENGFNPLWILDSRPGTAGDALCHQLATGLRSLDLGFTVAEEFFDPLIALLQFGHHLTSLIFDRIEHTSGFQDAPQALEFPQLEMLKVDVHREPFYRYVTHKWNMPRLASLILVDCLLVPIELLEAHGSRLTYLFFSSQYRDRYGVSLPPVHDVVLPRLAELCPCIEHLVIRVPQEALSSIHLSSPTLRYLDITHDFLFDLRHYKLLAFAEDTHAPALQLVRFTSSYGWFFPQMCDPSLLLDQKIDLRHMSDDELERLSLVDLTSQGIAHLVPGEIVRQTWWCVGLDPRTFLTHPLLEPWLDAVFEADEDNDSSYVPDSDSDDGSSDAWSASSESWSGFGSDVWTEYESDSESGPD